jgi:hypothetical protein
MKKNVRKLERFFACLGICFIFGLTGAIAQTYTIVPGVRFGAITARTSEADLKRIYGRDNVRDVEVGLGEGETMPGTVVFPNDESKKIEIVWKDQKRKRSPDFIQFYGDRSVWKTSDGIGLGTSLKVLEKLNGRGFTLAGFQWDYSGTVLSWRGGKLARLFGDKVTLRLNPNYDKGPEKDLNAVMGDGGFPSKHKSMQRLNPKVDFMAVHFR